MKIKSITIAGLHNVDNRTYDFNNVNYLYGDNGAGKSTVLAAIQLALLGYIPGTPKTNEGILRHANKNSIAVDLTLVDEKTGTEYKIARSWVKTGTKVNSTVSTIPEGLDINALLGNASLPVFDFNEFMSMTANKQKEWFIQFLPSSDSAVDWELELKEAVKDTSLEYSDILEETLGRLSEMSGSDMDKAIQLNTMLKEDISFAKGSLDRATSTIQTLLYYDDFVQTREPEEIKAEIDELRELSNKLVKYESDHSRKVSIEDSLSYMKISCETYEDDPEYKELKQRYDDVSGLITHLKENVDSTREQVMNTKAEIGKYSAILSGTGTCPYTKVECEEVKAKIDSAKEEVAKLNEVLSKHESDLSGLNKAYNDQMLEAQSLPIKMNDIKNRYSNAVSLQLELSALKDIEKPTEMTQLEISEKIAEDTEELSKIEANRRYNLLNESITKDKFAWQNKLDIYKKWEKLTAANGIQTRLANAPFEKLESEVNKYLKAIMSDKITSKFILSEKANSFAFGINRNDEYIAFESLSSGEKCLFTIALLMTLIAKSDSSIKLLLADDILDHLDDKKAYKLFEALNKLNVIQGIIAGVKECKLPDQKIVIEIK